MTEGRGRARGSMETLWRRVARICPDMCPGM
jgi:hypothetical protein